MKKKDLNEDKRVQLLSKSEEDFEKEMGFTKEKWDEIKRDLSKREENISAKLNSKAPYFEAVLLDSNGNITDREVSLSDFNEKILALVLGSYTCPVFRKHNSRINEIYSKYRDKVSFLQIYVYEMHSIDGWMIPVNLKDNIVYDQPTNDNERASVAKDWIKNKKIEMPVALDDMNNKIDSLYAGSPERLYVIDRNGIIKYRSSVGPFEDKEVDGWEQVIKDLLK